MSVFRFSFFLAGATLLPACGSSDTAPGPTADSGGISAGGADAGAASGTGGMAFPPSSGGTPSADADPCSPHFSTDLVRCPEADPAALFVAPGAHGSGTRDEPLGEIGAALYQAIVGARLRVIVCNGTYTENVVISGTRTPLQVHGGYTCPSSGHVGWKRTPDTRPIVAPLTGAALLVREVGLVTIQDMEFQSAAAVVPGESSIAAMVHAAGDLRLERVEIRAGSGAKGEDGVNGEPGESGALSTVEQSGTGAQCTDAAVTRGIALPESSCGSRGGSGAEAFLGDVASAGTSGVPHVSAAPTGAGRGGDGADLQAGDGRAGALGADGSPGQMGLPATSIGTFQADRYFPASAGGSGRTGGTGQGGGGGGASWGSLSVQPRCYGAGGGAGGMGGCGGESGGGGSSGGASVALIAWDSSVTLSSSTLISARGGGGGSGGHGGSGGDGQDGGWGGGGYAVALIGGGGDGGHGGKGGPGGAGAGGSGGPSFALVFHGTEVVQVGSTSLQPGPGGEEGAGGQQLDGAANALRAPNGVTGKSAKIYEQI